MEDDILIDEAGNIRFVYTDLLDAVFADTERTTTRASHVEPASEYCAGTNRPFSACPCPCTIPIAAQGWVADMAPVGGPVLGTYVTRQEALDAEREWLRQEQGL